MRKTLSLFAGISLVLTGLSGVAEAARRERKPWLMIGHGKKTVLKAVEHPASPVVAAPVEIRRESRAVTKRPAVANRETDKGRKIARQALAYKGTKYKFGGTSKKGLDCSGLVSRVYTDLKMGRVPRVSASLYQTGAPVRTAELRPGDLVFFKNTYKRGVSHVGVYAGRNKFVHASNKRRGVIETSMADPYYQLHYAGARRLY